MTRRKTLDLPKHKNPTHADRTACAPYNFVPLPDKVILAVEDANDLPGHDIYADETYMHTGYFDVTLTTKSPLYIRCALQRGAFDLEERGRDRNDVEINQQTRYADRIKNTPDFFYTRDKEQPVIPGSSLRGMLRNLLEIISYGKVKNVSNKPKVFFRAVAASGDDPIGQIYKATMRSVEAGYLVKRNNEWFVHPAKRPDADRDLRGLAFLKVKESEIVSGSVRGFVPFNDDNYQPQYHDVSFDAVVYYGNDDKAYVAVTNIGTRTDGYKYKGVLVCSGNMREIGQDATESPRRRHAIVLEADKDKDLIKINPQAVADYTDALTSFLQSPPFDEYIGCLKEGRPIFYVKAESEIKLFGHTPNFRLPASSAIKKGTATPLDFMPVQLNKPEEVDYAEAVFGFVRTSEEISVLKKRNASITQQGSKKRAYASRVFVTDAVLAENTDDLWLVDGKLTPKILATPKPETFPHYLVQTSREKAELKHYGSSSPEETVIRGHKLYWHQGNRSADDIKEDNQRWFINGRVDEISRQHTQMKPVKSGASFKFRVYFENLSEEELGALCWTLRPLGDAGKQYFHKLGMGKPFGMGAVELKATLHLSNRRTRYESLFDGNAWQTGYSSEGEELNRSNAETRTQKFEQKIIDELTPFKRGQTCTRLAEVRRVAMLLKMMEWPGFQPRAAQQGTPANQQDRIRNTRYMTLELEGVEAKQKNEYKERPVLPDPSHFGELTGEVEPQPEDNPTDNPPRGTEVTRGGDAGKGDAPTRATVATPTPRVTQAHAENKATKSVSLSDIERRQAERRQAEKVVKQSDGEYDETATVVEIIADGKVTLETKSKKTVVGKLQNSFLQIEVGDRCRTKIRYLKGEAVSAKVISRL